MRTKKRILMILAMINMFILGFILPLLAEAETTVTGTGLELGAGFSCSNLEVNVNVNGEGVSSEEFFITNEKGLAYDATGYYEPAVSRAGTFSKVIDPSLQNVNFTGSRYIAITYVVGLRDFSQKTAILYDCLNKSTVVSCNDLAGQNCGWSSVRSYFPRIEVEYAEDEAEVEVSSHQVLVGMSDRGYLNYDNNGFLDLNIDFQNIQVLNDPLNEFKFTKFEDSYLSYIFTPKKPGNKEIIVQIPHNDPFKPAITVKIPFKVPNSELLSLKVKNLNYKKEGDTAIIEGSVIVGNTGSRALTRRSSVEIGLYNSETPADTQMAMPGSQICSYYAQDSNYSTTVAKLSIPRIRAGKTLEIPFKSKKLVVSKHSLSSGDRLLFNILSSAPVSALPDSDGIILGDSKDYSISACYSD